MIRHVQQLGRSGLNFFAQLGRSAIFLLQTITRLPNWRQWTGALSEQFYQVGVLSLVIIGISGLFIGMVVALQGYNTLERFGSAEELGQLLALSITRELGPVVTALLFAGRAGSALTAEIALMKTTDQLASMEMMAVDPIAKIVAPRFWAVLISVPILVILFDVISIYGGYWVGVDWLGIEAAAFWGNMQSAVDFRYDVLNGIIKSVVFGMAIAWVALFQGYFATPTPAGMSKATTRTVVYSSLLVLGLDFVLTALMMGGW